MFEIKNIFPKDVSLNGHKIDELFYRTLAETGIAFLLVLGILIYFMFRYRERSGHLPLYTHGNRWPHLFLTLFLAFCVFFFIDMHLANLSSKVWDDFHAKMPTQDALQVRVLAQQYAWNIQYSGKDGQFDTPDDVITMNQLHIPVHKPIVVQLQSKDVIHSFWLPNFRLKQDVVPGMTQRIWFEATQTGEFEIACAELCGLGHYRMRGILTIQTQEEFEQWLKERGSEKKVQSKEEEW